MMGGFLLMLLGIFNAAFPYPAWYMSIGWRIKDAEPTEAALFMNRAVGVIAALVGLIIMFSSCSVGGGSSSGYADVFQKRLIAGEVQDIKMGMSAAAPSVLTEDEVAHAVDLMAHAPMESFKLDAMYGAGGEATIVYADGTTDELLLWGPSGGIELHPRSGGDRAYRFQSDELESLFRSWGKRVA
ncbi:hypothetical protein GZH47_26590 [Paenibacillus rhizovicinus]|uniref:DUF6199 domain-containing protein n=1 Tax=Paenibacillus rhizovicinus TaxID=2704463 RepID=A0A6C0P678_9BACL|nr:hypothetical protein [Paenibacillus rhizovicinus]QHW34007.1 hypothetical protein GZH47_26590 [Paenibacillus rhizovicinus]